MKKLQGLINDILMSVFLKNKNVIGENTPAPKTDGDRSVLTTAQMEGPFYFSSPLRADVTEDRKGVLLTLKLLVVDVNTQIPVKNAIVEIWHCDAEGNYSGYPEGLAHNFIGSLRFTGIAGMLGKKHINPVNKRQYLRGSQQTDENGYAYFTTIFPGWYEPRAAHIHFKVFVNNIEYLTSQFYFDQKLTDTIYTKAEPYKKYGRNPYKIGNGLALRTLTNIYGVLLAPTWRDKDKLEVSAKIGINGPIKAKKSAIAI